MADNDGAGFSSRTCSEIDDVPTAQLEGTLRYNSATTAFYPGPPGDAGFEFQFETHPCTTREPIYDFIEPIGPLVSAYPSGNFRIEYRGAGGGTWLELWDSSDFLDADEAMRPSGGSSYGSSGSRAFLQFPRINLPSSVEPGEYHVRITDPEGNHYTITDADVGGGTLSVIDVAVASGDDGSLTGDGSSTTTSSDDPEDTTTTFEETEEAFESGTAIETEDDPSGSTDTSSGTMSDGYSSPKRDTEETIVGPTDGDDVELRGGPAEPEPPDDGTLPSRAVILAGLAVGGVYLATRGGET